ncbi:MAG: efflux RND transporter periplasmic adaptor subunit [Bacillota bacterium]|jgi:HlyD family secretion protein
MKLKKIRLPRGIRGKKESDPSRRRFAAVRAKLGKNKKITALIAVVSLLAVAFVAIVAVQIFGGGAVPTVEVVAVAREDLRSTVDTSGSVGSTVTKTYYAPVSAPLGDVVRKKGDIVSAGDLLVNFDCTALAEENKTAQLEKSSAVHANNDALAQNNAKISAAKKARAKVKDYQSQVDSLQKKLAELNTRAAEKSRQAEAAGADPSTDAAVVSVNNEIASVNAKIEKTQSLLAEAQAAANGDEGALTADGIAQLKENSALAEAKAAAAAEALKKGQEGVKADFDGIVISVGGVSAGEGEAAAAVSGGYMATQGGELMTVASLGGLCVDVNIAKADFSRVEEGQSAVITIDGRTYSGTVSSIGNIAQKNEKGGVVMAAQVKINDNDGAIVYGSDAKVAIEMPVVAGALVIPAEAVNISKDGSFVYILRDGVIEKRPVVTGVSADGKIAVSRGLEEGDEVIRLLPDGLEEGMIARSLTDAEE